MADECIHGLEGGLCDQCFPKPAVEVTAPVAKQRATRPTSLRTTPASTKTPPRTPRTAVRAAAKSVDNVGEQRIYHITHVRNLAGILSSGRLLADASEGWDDTRPEVDISAPGTRESRRAILVSGPESPSVASHVPFFLAPNPRMWDGMRLGKRDARLSPDARRAVPADFVMLISTVKTAIETRPPGEDAIAVADGDAAGKVTVFGTTPEDGERMLRRLRAEEEPAAILDAEFLVLDSFPVELVTLVGVANDKARDEVKAIIAASDFRPKVAVYPPWFQKPEIV